MVVKIKQRKINEVAENITKNKKTLFNYLKNIVST